MIPAKLSRGIPLTSILVVDRAREDYGADFDEFKESIKLKGLLQPIVLMKASGLDEETQHILIAGGRRFKAFEELAAEGDRRFTTIPATVYDHTEDMFERKSMELIENIQRKDFTVAEAAKLRQELHALQTSIHGAAVRGKPTEASRKRWAPEDTAKMLGESRRTFDRNLQVAAAIDKHPELAKAKTQKEVLKVVVAEGEDAIRAELAARQKNKQVSAGSLEARQAELCEHYATKDCFEYFSDLRDSSINLINLDWPYGIDFRADKALEGTVKYSDEEVEAAYGNNASEQAHYDWMSRVLDECYRVLKPNSWLLVWYFIHPQHPWMVKQLTKRGFEFGAPALWMKGHSRSTVPSVLLGHSYETFLYARKGKPALAKGRTNIYDYPRSHVSDHPAEKPVELMQDILGTFTYEGATILDPFLGSGNSILAAANLGDRQVFGCDLLPTNKDKFILRTHAAKPGAYTSY